LSEGLVDLFSASTIRSGLTTRGHLEELKRGRLKGVSVRRGLRYSKSEAGKKGKSGRGVVGEKSIRAFVEMDTKRH